MKGGKRENAGRPKGAKDKLLITDHFSMAEIKNLVKIAKRDAETKPEILKFLLEQVFGKAKQSVEMTGDVNLKIDV
jgi:hypothetical protein